MSSQSARGVLKCLFTSLERKKQWTVWKTKPLGLSFPGGGAKKKGIGTFVGGEGEGVCSVPFMMTGIKRSKAGQMALVA